jgi:putative hemin transport protein
MNQDLKQRWANLKQEQPKIRIRNAAETLNTSELELLHTIGEPHVIFLQPEFKSILLKIQSLGTVMALTRNNSVVHEVTGLYDKPQIDESPVGMFLGDLIDLRIFFHSWKYALAVEESGRYSLQFFNGQGGAIHKIYITEHSNKQNFDALVEEFRISYPSEIIAVAAPTTPPTSSVDQIDIAAMQQDWINMKDTHEFFGMLKKYNISRIDALRNAPTGDYAVQIDPSSIQRTLQRCAENKIPIMSFVGNPGMIQIFSGEISKLFDTPDWFNIMDPTFNLHIKKIDIDQAWVVRKPSVDGFISSIECYDQHGEIIVQFFGKRKPGIPEIIDWTHAVDMVAHEYAL